MAWIERNMSSREVAEWQGFLLLQSNALKSEPGAPDDASPIEQQFMKAFPRG